MTCEHTIVLVGNIGFWFGSAIGGLACWIGTTPLRIKR